MKRCLRGGVFGGKQSANATSHYLRLVYPGCVPHLQIDFVAFHNPEQLVPTRTPRFGVSTTRQNLRVVTRAKSDTATKAPAAEQWWKKDADLWVHVQDMEGFKQEVMNSTLPVVVDWYASWCTGCQRSYPEVCKVLKNNPDLRTSFKFVKICVDDVKALSREQGISALPRMSLYRPGQGRVVTWDIPVSRVKHLKQNLQTVLANPNNVLALDPNSFIIPMGPIGSEEVKKVEVAKAEAVASLEQKSESLFDRLKAVANGTAGKAAAAAKTKAVPTTAQPDSPSDAAATNNGLVRAPSWTDAALLDKAVPKSKQEYIASFVAQFGQDYALERQMFLNRYGQEYGYGGCIDDLYPKEVGVRMAPLGTSHRQQHYMDYTGSSVYCNSQLEAVFKELATTMFGNPHASSPSSELSSERIDEVRSMILRFFNADASEWQVVFTRSATGALKMVGETFPWSSGSLFRYLRENHNSVLGIREYALQHKAAFEAVDEELVTEWLSAPPPPSDDEYDDEASRHDHTPDSCTGTNADGSCEVEWGDEADEDTASTPKHKDDAADVTYSLFAFPAEDNFAGVKYPLSWATDIKRRSTDSHKWMVLIDAAAYAPTQPLDLSKVDADFVDVAFYKMFGYPTGLGALLVRTEAVPLLRKVFWGGGSVALATSTEDFHVLKCRPNEMLEDGTVSFLDIISLKHGFNMMTQLGGIHRIQAHVASLTEWMYQTIAKTKHSNGRRLARVFGKHAQLDHRKVQGGILNFVLQSPTGLPFSYKAFEKEAAAAGFHVRTGAECNPGACYTYLGIADQEIEQLAGVKEGCEDEVEYVSVQRPDVEPTSSIDVLASLSDEDREGMGLPAANEDNKWVQAPLGSIRVSLGWMSTFEDAYAMVRFIAAYKDKPSDQTATV